MLFKLFTLFSMFALSTSTSVSPRHRQCSSVNKHGGSGWGVGSSGGMGIFGQTVTVTVTETVTVTPTETSDSTETIDSTVDSSNDSSDLDSQEHCLYLFNEFRKSQNLPLFESATQEQIDCADKAAAYDAQAGYHASFYNQMCANVGGSSPASQCSCMKNVGLYDLPNSDPNDPLKNCINAYIAEKTLGMYPSEKLGHWKIISSENFRSVACGTDGDGFYVHNFYN